MIKSENLSAVKEVTIRDIWEAKKRITPLVHKTKLLHSNLLSQKHQSQVFLKLENLHDTGSFKIRGAANKILSLTEAEKQNGVTTFSTGNHGMAVAYVAKQLGIKATVCISNRVPEVKVQKLKELGAEVVIVGENQDDAEAHCYELEKDRGMTVIKPFDDPYIISGQGTIGLELFEDLPNVDTVIVPLSGGGLLSGVGFTLKTINPSIEVIGVSMERSPVMYESLKANRPVVLKEQPTLADSLLGGIGLNNQYTFNMVKKYMDDVVLLTEEEIAEGMFYMLKNHRMGIEGASATGIAALLSNKVVRKDKNIAIIISGCNVDMSLLLQIGLNHLEK